MTDESNLNNSWWFTVTESNDHTERFWRTESENEVETGFRLSKWEFVFGRGKRVPEELVVELD